MDGPALVFGIACAFGGIVIYELSGIKDKIGFLTSSEDTAVRELREVKGLLGIAVDYLRKIESNTEH